MSVAQKRVLAHVIRKPVIEPDAVCEVIEAPSETTRVDLRELQHMLAPPVDLDTDIEVCAEPAAQPVSSSPRRLAHVVRRAESAPIVTPETITREMPAVVTPPPVKQRDRLTMFAAAAFAAAAIGFVIVVVL